MKTGVKLFLCLFLAVVLLLPAFFVPASAQDLRYGSGNDNADRILFADELFDLLFAEELPLSDFERAYLRSKEALAITYSDADLPAALVTWSYDGENGTLTVTASAFQYTAQNGETVIWVPQTVRASDGVFHPLAQNENDYSYTYSEIWNSGSTELTVEYAWTAVLSAEAADAILTGAYPAAKAIREWLDAYEIDHAEWERQTALYSAYCEALETYRKAYRRWEQKKQNYETYLAAKAAYEASVEEYQTLSAAWQAYNNYRRLLAEYIGAMERYGSYAQTMQTVNACLAVMETMFTPTTDGNEWCFYPSIMGETVDSVLDNCDKLVKAGMPKSAGEGAKNATNALRPLLLQYAQAREQSYGSAFEKQAALFAVYTGIYDQLRVQIGALYDCILAIYSYSPAQFGMKNKYPEKIPHFRQFLSQLYILQALLDDFETVDLSLALPLDDDNLHVGDLLETALRPTDTDRADPVGVVFPQTYLEAPVAPAVVEKPEKEIPENPEIYGAPAPVEAPGNEPVAPEPVVNPGAEPVLQPLTDEETALLAQYDEGLLTERTAKGTEQSLSFTKSVSQTAIYQNKRTVVFYKTDGSELEKRTVEYGDPVASPPCLSDYQTEQYTYTFLGWIPTGSGATEPLALDCVQTDLSLSPLFARKKRAYTVTWELLGSSVTIPVEYGEIPTPPETPTRPDDETYFYQFAGWSPAILPVSGDTTYTALWQAYPLYCQITWDLGTGDPVTLPVAYGELPEYPGTPERADDELYSYSFRAWSPAVTEAVQDATYTAVWDTELIQKPVEWYTVTWDLGNGTQTTVQVESGGLPQYQGTPTRPQDACNTYTFVRWEPAVVPVTEDTTYTAVWQTAPRLYSITWDLGNGEQTTVSVAYGEAPEYPGTPTRPQDERNVYTFAGWSPEVTTVSENATYTAVWQTTPRVYIVTWDLGNGETVTQSLAYGELPHYSGTPARQQDGANTYTFIGWLPEVAPVTQNATYTARWKSNERLYTVAWDLGNGNVTTTTVGYGKLPEYPGTPARPQDERNVYTFAEWSPEVTAVSENTIYTAVWTVGARYYDVAWEPGFDVGERINAQYTYGEMPEYPGTPTRPQDEEYSYAFAGWSPEMTAVKENAVYTATWKAIPLFYQITWDTGTGDTLTVSVPNGETPVFDGTPLRADDETYCYTFIGWSPELLPANANATYTARWQKSPLVRDADGNAYQTETTETAVIIPAAMDELDLKNAIDFAAEDGKTVALQRESATVTLDAETLRERLPEMSGVRWVEEADERSFRVDFLDSEGNALQTELSYRVALSYAENQILTVYEVEGQTMRKLSADSVDAAGRLAIYSVPAGKTVLYKAQYRLNYTSDREYYNTDLPVYAEEGETISLPIECEYGYEFTGAALIYGNGETVAVENAFVMPAEPVTVELHIAPIVYHVVFLCREEVLSDREYAFGETIELPADPALPDEGENRFIFRGWTPQVSETATGEERELIYRANFSVVSNRPQEKIDASLWHFFVSPLFLGFVAVVVGIAGAIVLIVVIRKKRLRKKAAAAPAQEEKKEH